MSLRSPDFADILGSTFSQIVAPSPQNDECKLHPTVLNKVPRALAFDKRTTVPDAYFATVSTNPAQDGTLPTEVCEVFRTQLDLLDSWTSSFEHWDTDDTTHDNTNTPLSSASPHARRSLHSQVVFDAVDLHSLGSEADGVDIDHAIANRYKKCVQQYIGKASATWGAYHRRLEQCRGLEISGSAGTLIPCRNRSAEHDILGVAGAMSDDAEYRLYYDVGPDGGAPTKLVARRKYKYLTLKEVTESLSRDALLQILADGDETKAVERALSQSGQERAAERRGIQAMADQAVNAALERLAGLDPAERVEALLEKSVSDAADRRKIAELCKESRGDDFVITCPKFLKAQHHPSTSIPLVSVCDADFDALSKVLEPCATDPHMRAGLITEVSAPRHVSPQCRLLQIDALDHKLYCQNLNNVDVFEAVGSRINKGSGGVPFRLDTKTGEVFFVSNSGRELLFCFSTPSLPAPKSGIAEVLISDADMEMLQSIGNFSSRPVDHHDSENRTRRLHCDIRVARRWTLPPATRAEAYQASCEIETRESRPGELRRTLMKFFQLSTSSRGAQKIATIPLDTNGLPSRDLRLEFNTKHSKLSIVAFTGGRGAEPRRAKVAIIWVPQRRSNSVAVELSAQTISRSDSHDDEPSDDHDEEAVSEMLQLPQGEVVDARWHPSEADTIVALTAQGRLAMYCLEHNGAILQFSVAATFAPRTLPVSELNESSDVAASVSDAQRAESRIVHFSFGTTAQRAAADRVAARIHTIFELWGAQSDARHLRKHAHAVLGVDKDATPQAIRAAHRRLSRLFANVNGTSSPYITEVLSIVDKATQVALQSVAQSKPTNTVGEEQSGTQAQATTSDLSQDEPHHLECVVYAYVVHAAVVEGIEQSTRSTQYLEAYTLPPINNLDRDFGADHVLDAIQVWGPWRPAAVQVSQLSEHVTSVPHMFEVCSAINALKEQKVPRSRIRCPGGSSATTLASGDRVEVRVDPGGRWYSAHVSLVHKSASSRSFDVIYEDAFSSCVGGGSSALLTAWFAPHPFPTRQHFTACLSTKDSSSPVRQVLQDAGPPRSLLSSHPRLCAHGRDVFVLRSVLRGDRTAGHVVVSRIEKLDMRKFPRSVKWRPVVDVHLSPTNPTQIEDFQSFDVLSLSQGRLGQTLFGCLRSSANGGVFASRIVAAAHKYEHASNGSKTPTELLRQRTETALLQSPSSSFTGAEMLLLGDGHGDLEELNESKGVREAMAAVRDSIAQISHALNNRTDADSVEAVSAALRERMELMALHRRKQAAVQAKLEEFRNAIRLEQDSGGFRRLQDEFERLRAAVEHKKRKLERLEMLARNVHTRATYAAEVVHLNHQSLQGDEASVYEAVNEIATQIRQTRAEWRLLAKRLAEKQSHHGQRRKEQREHRLNELFG